MHQNQVGSLLQRGVIWGGMIRKGGELTHKYSGINSSKICDSNSHKRTMKYRNSLAGGYTQQRTLAHQQVHSAIWSYLFSKQIAMSVEYLPSALNVYADWESRNAKTNSEWKLDVSVFQELVTHMGQLTVDLFTSRLCHQLLHPWDRECDFAFPPFSLISRVQRKILEEKIDHLIIVTPTWQTQPWYAQLLKMSVQPPFLLPQIRNLLTNPQGKNHPLVETGSLRLAVLKVFGKVCKWKEFQAMLPKLSHIQGEKAQQQLRIGLGSVN